MIILVRGEKMATSMVLGKIEEFVIGGSDSCVSEIAHGTIASVWSVFFIVKNFTIWW